MNNKIKEIQAKHLDEIKTLKKRLEEHDYHYLAACEQRDGLNARLKMIKDGPTSEQIKVALKYLNTDNETNFWAAYHSVVRLILEQPYE